MKNIISPDTNAVLVNIAHEYAVEPYSHRGVQVSAFAMSRLVELPPKSTTLITGDEILNISVNDAKGKRLLFVDVHLGPDRPAIVMPSITKDEQGHTIPPEYRKLTEDEGRALIADIHISMNELRKSRG